MPNLDNLMEQTAEIVNSAEEGKLMFSSLDMLYAQMANRKLQVIARHCNFQITVGKVTGTYEFNTGYYGLTTMPPEFQQIMDNILFKVQNTFTFINDILIVTKRSKEQHLEKVEQVQNILDEARTQLKENNSQVVLTETEWLEFKFLAK